MGKSRTSQSAAATTNECENDYHRDDENVDISERRGLLPLHDLQKGKPRIVSIRRKLQDQRLRDLLEASPKRKDDWMRPYWLGFGLFLILFPFWLLDTLKDAVFGALINGNLQDHLPIAKLVSVCTTLALVFFLEYVAQERKRVQLQQIETLSRDEVLNEGGTWNRMGIKAASDDGYWNDQNDATADAEDRVPSSIFASIGVPYCIFFGLMAYMLQFNPATAWTAGSANLDKSGSSNQSWQVLGYCLYAAIESFGSLAVATFWSYTNSTLSLNDAETYYGTIIAFAQMGAIAGSTMVTMHVWNSITLFIVACLVILLHIIVMMSYSRRFSPTSNVAAAQTEETILAPANAADEPTVWSGVHLVLKHNYVLLILGVSCLYEVSLTCLNYQMTLLGWTRFEKTSGYNPDESSTFSSNMSFTQFMGHYGQMVNVSSLILSSLIFPLLIHRCGLKYTLRVFPTLLLIVNIIAFGALPGNLAVLFFSISLLKAMTYSIHDPAKEILYIPTSNAIKFKAKFWIDVVGARFAKAIGSSINHMSGSVHRSIRVASAPSLLTAAALWFVCYRVGTQFEELVVSGNIVGLDEDPLRMHPDYSAEHDEDGDHCGSVQETQESMELTAI
jgi:ATP/ADP translocase